MSSTVAKYGERGRRVELESGEVIDGVQRVTRENLSSEERQRLADASNRMRTRTSQRLHLHTAGSGHRVVYPEEIEAPARLREVPA